MSRFELIEEFGKQVIVMTPTLFDTLTARARRTDPVTSHAAASRANALGLPQTHGARILAAVRAEPGMTADGIAAATSLSVVQVDRMAIELERAGLIERRGVYDGKLRWWPMTQD